MSLFSFSSNDFFDSLKSGLSIKTDLDCKVFENGKEIGKTRAGSCIEILLHCGIHTLTFVFSEDSNLSKSIRYNIRESSWAYTLSVEMMKEFDALAEEYNNSKKYNSLYTLCIKAACQGYSIAQYWIGNCYWNGKGVAKNLEKAIGWYTEAAKNGLAIAQYQLGYCYRFGQGVERNYSKAIEWYTKAAKQGDAFAQHELGECFLEKADRLFAKDKYRTVAVRYYILSAEYYEKATHELISSDFESPAECFFKVGRFYEKGIGVEKSISKAMKYYYMSVMFFNENAKSDLNRLERNGGRLVKYLFFDTETTGLPKNDNAPTSDSKNWPRLVQLSWITTDEDCNIISKNDFIIYPENFFIPYDAAQIHGITTRIARERGELLRNVIKKFIEDFNTAITIVGHNIAFDKKIIGAELVRLGQEDIMKYKESLCTMKASVKYCKIPGHRGYKYPSLQELHKKLFGYGFEDAHNSMCDVEATLKCFKKLKQLGVLL